MGGGSASKFITEATIRADAERFSQLHSWNKHLKGFGTPFCLFFQEGEQLRNAIHPQFTDHEGLHLHFIELYENASFIEQLPLACRNYPVVLTRNFEGHSTQPDSSTERDRQKMLDEIMQCAIRIATELGVLAKEDSYALEVKQ